MRNVKRSIVVKDLELAGKINRDVLVVFEVNVGGQGGFFASPKPLFLHVDGC